MPCWFVLVFWIELDLDILNGSSPVAFITTFVTLFALVIAITKDLPDVEGDRK